MELGGIYLGTEMQMECCNNSNDDDDEEDVKDVKDVIVLVVVICVISMGGTMMWERNEERW